jgi:hypothetical protein
MNEDDRKTERIHVEPETVAIERQGSGDTLDDEERRDAGNFWVSHLSFHRQELST